MLFPFPLEEWKEWNLRMGGMFSPHLKSDWSGFKVSMHRAQSCLLAFRGLTHVPTKVRQWDAPAWPQRPASGVNSNDICGPEGCIQLTDSWEGVGLMPSWKFLYRRESKVGLWKLRKGVGATNRQRNIPCQRKLIVHSGWEAGRCVPSPLNQDLSFCHPEDPESIWQWYLPLSPPCISPLLSHKV